MYRLGHLYYWKRSDLIIVAVALAPRMLADARRRPHGERHVALSAAEPDFPHDHIREHLRVDRRAEPPRLALDDLKRAPLAGSLHLRQVYAPASVCADHRLHARPGEAHAYLVPGRRPSPDRHGLAALQHHVVVEQTRRLDRGGGLDCGKDGCESHHRKDYDH